MRFFCFSVIVACSLLRSCSGEIEETKDTRDIRGHLVQLEGVMHADGAFSAPQLCSHCHGENLQGGNDTPNPSCYSCHGEYWFNSSASSNAPSDHIVNNGGFLHKSGSADPANECSVCHQFQNEVHSELDTRPHCLSCHEQKW